MGKSGYPGKGEGGEWVGGGDPLFQPKNPTTPILYMDTWGSTILESVYSLTIEEGLHCVAVGWERSYHLDFGGVLVIEGHRDIRGRF